MTLHALYLQRIAYIADVYISENVSETREVRLRLRRLGAGSSELGGTPGAGGRRSHLQYVDPSADSTEVRGRALPLATPPGPGAPRAAVELESL